MTKEQYIEQYKTLSEYAFPTWATIALIVAGGVFIVGIILSFVTDEIAVLFYAGAVFIFLFAGTALLVKADESDYRNQLSTEIASLKSAYIAEAPHRAYPVFQIETKEGAMTALVDVGDRYELVTGLEKNGENERRGLRLSCAGGRAGRL